MCRRGALGLVLCLGLVLAAPAAGGDIYGRKHSVDSRIGSLRARIDAARAREDTLSAQIAGVTAQIRRLESRVGDVSQHLATLQADLDLHKRRLARLTELYTLQTQRLVFLKQQYGTAVDRLSLRLIEVYEEGEPSTIDVALSATSFSDLVNQLDYVRDLGQSDSRIASDVGDARDSMRVARAKTKKVRATVGSETRVIAVRTEQVRAVRDALLASSHKLSRSRTAERASLASVRESKQAFVNEVEGLQQTSSQPGRYARYETGPYVSPRGFAVSQRPFVWMRSRTSPLESAGPHVGRLSSTGKCPYGDWPCMIRSAPITPE